MLLIFPVDEEALVIVASLAEDDDLVIKHVRLPHAYALAATATVLERIIAAFFCPSNDETLTMHFDLFSPAIQKVFARLLLERNGADAGKRRSKKRSPSQAAESALEVAWRFESEPP